MTNDREREARELWIAGYKQAALHYTDNQIDGVTLETAAGWAADRAGHTALTREQREGVHENDAIAAAFREVIGPNGACISNDEIADYITQRSREIMANAPQPEAQGAVAVESRFFIDHGVVHDRKTGKHLRGADEFGCLATDLLSVLQDLEGAAQPLRLRFSREWLRKGIAADGDEEPEAATPPAPVDVRLRELADKWERWVDHNTTDEGEAFRRCASDLRAILDGQQTGDNT